MVELHNVFANLSAMSRHIWNNRNSIIFFIIHLFDNSYFVLYSFGAWGTTWIPIMHCEHALKRWLNRNEWLNKKHRSVDQANKPWQHLQYLTPFTHLSPYTRFKWMNVSFKSSSNDIYRFPHWWLGRMNFNNCLGCIQGFGFDKAGCWENYTRLHKWPWYIF